MRRFYAAPLHAALLLVAASGLSAQEPEHPLDPLGFQEYWAVLETLDSAEKLDQDTRFSLVSLVEPPKDLVWGWSPGDALPRQALAVVRQGPDTYEAVVDLAAGKLVSWELLEGQQPNWLSEEFGQMTKETLDHPEFLAALAKRGIKNTAFVDCSAGPPGYYGTPEQVGRRVAYVRCHDLRNVRNRWTRQIEGLGAVVDMTEKKILRIVDEGPVTTPETFADYDAQSLGPAREVPGKMYVEQSPGPGYARDGHLIEWQKWRFHVRPDQRTGMMVSAVSYEDGSGPRPILYQGYMAEMFVPYMDPAQHWYIRNFMDAGEFPAGGLAKPLMPGLDCPDHATYYDGLINDDHGRPAPRPKLICVFERETGDMAWRHHTKSAPVSRAKRDLVVRSAAVLGNYDYVFDWIFQQDGSIRVAVGATGIVEAKMVDQASAKEASGKADTYGRFVDKNIVGVNHDHYFNFRLDLDVDGSENRFLKDRLVQELLPKEHPRRSVWVREPHWASKESDAMLNIDLTKPTLWRVVSAKRKNGVGYPTSYQLMPGMTAETLLSEDDYPRRRARFIEHHLWVTPFDEKERFPAGDYPTLSTPEQGLPEWTKNDRSIGGGDIVLWHTIGMHHLVRAEDWPVMPVLWHSFELRPFDFFDRNPAMDLPE